MKLDRAGFAGLLVALVAVPVAGADVRVRAEGPDGTLLKTSVPRTGPDVTKAGATCAGDSAAGALDRAAGSANWDADNFGGSLFANTILGVHLGFSSDQDDTNDRYWAFDHNHVFAQEGICEYKPQDGDQLLFFAACATASSLNCFDGQPLDIAAPESAEVGMPFTVSVREFTDAGVPSAAAAATVSWQGQSVTTGADGTAQVTVSSPGTVVLTATKGRQVRDAASVGVVEYPVPTPTATPADTSAPVSTILRVAEGQVFRRRRKAPRTLRARVQDDRGLASVELGITRRVGRRCTAYDDTLGRFARVRCGRHPRFEIGTAARVSLLLPKRLGRGRYTYEVRATDQAGNVERRERGRNRVVFRVR